MKRVALVASESEKSSMSSNLSGPPPAKRPRLSEPARDDGRTKASEKAPNVSNGPKLAAEPDIDDEEEEEEVLRDLEEKRPSDLYLDTVSQSYHVFIYVEARQIDQSTYFRL